MLQGEGQSRTPIRDPEPGKNQLYPPIVPRVVFVVCLVFYSNAPNYHYYCNEPMLGQSVLF